MPPRMMSGKASTKRFRICQLRGMQLGYQTRRSRRLNDRPVPCPKQKQILTRRSTKSCFKASATISRAYSRKWPCQISRHCINPPMDGPFALMDRDFIISKHMRTFSFKLGFALFYKETFRKPSFQQPALLQPAGSPMSNIGKADFPRQYSITCSHLRHSEQGKFHVSDQFEYSWRLTDDNRMGMFFARFRSRFGRPPLCPSMQRGSLYE